MRIILEQRPQPMESLHDSRAQFAVSQFGTAGDDGPGSAHSPLRLLRIEIETPSPAVCYQPWR